ncbi:MAG TPA: hypothetical protein VFL90_17875, partial [Methylomirabilota bacterium]|nr:hypothetical protein [Methylomirabilota bacterium]
ARPLELALDGRVMVILSPGWRGDAAGEIYRVDLDAGLPADLSRRPAVHIPFSDARSTTLGSVAIEPRTHDLFLGEENGRRVWRLTADEQLTLYASGVHRLVGGSAMAFDAHGRLLLVDFADPLLTEGEQRPPAGLEQFRDEDYRGPLVFRLTLDPTIPLPRRLATMPPLFPRGWGGKAGGGLLPRMISLLPRSDDVLLLSSSGDVHRLAADGSLSLLARLPRGQYTRTHMLAAPDGSVFVSGGFQVGSVFRIAPDGAVSTVAGHVADPQGIAVDGRGDLYLAESAFHRILRVRIPPASQP